MIHKIHVTAIFDDSIDAVFANISNHETFLSGGGLNCKLIAKGSKDTNGDGAIRLVQSSQMSFEEKIFDFTPQQHFAYLITTTQPKMPLKHHKGWLDFTDMNGKTQVDWHSHFEITKPIIGPIMGWFMKRQLSAVFSKRLAYYQKQTRKT